MRHTGFATLLGLSLIASTGAHAQTSEAAAAPASPAIACELHVWPTASFSSNWQSLLGGSLLDRALHPGKDKEGRTKLVSGLDPDTQVAIFGSMDLPKMLGLPPARVVFHSPDRPGKTYTSMSRHTDSQSKCYGELAIQNILFEQHPILGRRLLIDFEYDDFYGQILRRWAAIKTVETKLKLFPPAEGQDADAAVGELTGVFRSDLEQFAAHVARKRVNDRQH